MLLYIIRHGETDWNRIYRLQGWSDIPLNESGRLLGEKTGEAMKDIPLDVCFSSPLLRAFETAQLVAKYHGIPVTADDRLKEICFGEAEGHRGRGENGQPLPIVEDFYRRPGIYVPPAGGESVRELCRRTWDFLEDITARPDLEDKSVFIGSHGAAKKSMLLWLRYVASDLHMSEEQVPYDRLWEGGLSPNCGVTIAEVIRGEARILEEDRVYASLPGAKPLTVRW